MDRNSIIGFVLIAGILITWTFLSQPSAEEIAKAERARDSIEQVELENQRRQAEQQAQSANTEQQEASAVAPEALSDSAKANLDSIKRAEKSMQFGRFADASEGEESFITIENEKLKVTISTKGGHVASATLKDYQTYDSLPVQLFDPDSSSFDILFSADNRVLKTSELFFTPEGSSFHVIGEDSNEVALRLYADSPDKYLEFVYSLKGGSYSVGFDLRVVGMPDFLRENSDMDLRWDIAALSKEKNRELEGQNTSVYFQSRKNGDMDYLSESSDDDEKPEVDLHWVSFKQQFFSAALIADGDEDHAFDNYKAHLSVRELSAEKHTKFMRAELSIPFRQNDNFEMMWYFGPNHYQTLENYGIGLQDQIALGWVVFAFVNEWLVIPLFNFLDENTGLNYGIIILILTLIIKMILFPLTWRNYYSSAKMRVLKPEIDELNEKFKDGDAMKKQQATMALYKKAGVNPLAGCIPMVLQMPILYAMFRFFPSSIELRQESFLWAEDLSTYDAIFTWTAEIPLISSMYGNHVSLFTLMMAISTFFYTKYNMQMTGSSNPQFPQMKMMIYFMPVMLLVFFNKYSAGLSYYYLTSNVISMLQQFTIKKFFINEEAIRKKINENKKKPQNKKKSGFSKRLENLAKQQQQKANQNSSRKKR